MAVTGPWITPPPMEAEPGFYWWDRAWDPTLDVVRGNMPTGAAPQSVNTGNLMNVDAAGYAVNRSPGFARSAVAFASHLEVVHNGVTYPAQHATATSSRFAEFHLNEPAGPQQYVIAPEGASVEYDYDSGGWVGDYSLRVECSVKAGMSGAQGSPVAHLARLPLQNGQVIRHDARTDYSTWTIIGDIVDSLWLNPADLPMPVRNALNDATPTSRTFDLTVPGNQRVLALGLLLPGMAAPFTPSAHPVEVSMAIASAFGGAYPTRWDLFGIGAQISAVTVRRRFQPRRYRFVYEKAPYTIQAGLGLGGTRFHQGGTHGL
jgi:hypothetical protein